MTTYSHAPPGRLDGYAKNARSDLPEAIISFVRVPVAALKIYCEL
ncbi:MAG: hypothetical protein WCJ95_21445 [Mariniphaga sp.]